MKRIRFLQGLALALCAAAAPAGFAQQASPAKPIRLIVPFPPGGATDISGRVLQEPLQRILGQTVVIDNRAGAGGSIGMSELARSAPDGLTLAVATLSTHGVNPAVFAKLPYDPIKDTVGVTELVKAPGVIVINPQELPMVQSFADLVKYLKANPGKVSYATPGNGTIGHMWGELFKSATGTSMVHIPYRGAGPALNDVLAGQVAVYFDQVASSLPYVKQGKLKALAVTSKKRLPILPNVPTVEEAGVTGYESLSWSGIVAPAGTPPAVVRKLNQAIDRILKTDEVRQRFAGLGVDPVGGPPEAFSQQIRTESDKWGKLIKSANITIE